MADFARRGSRPHPAFSGSRIIAGALACAGIALAGCSTVQGDWNQHLQIEVVDAQGRPVDGLRCTIGEGASAPTFVTPAPDVKVHRSAAPLAIDCRDPAGTPGREAIATVQSRRERMEEALLPFGSVGVFVDHLSGALYAYPTRLQLKLGQRLVLEHGAEAQVASAEALPAPPAAAAGPVAAVAPAAAPARSPGPEPAKLAARSAAKTTPKPVKAALAPKPAAPAVKVALAAAPAAPAAPSRSAPVNW